MEELEISRQSLDVEVAQRIFDMIDISENTRRDYKSRVQLFLQYVEQNGFHLNSFLEYKRYLEKRTDWRTATKNKYLAASRVFLKELHRQGVVPIDVTVNTKGFKESRKHKRDGINDEEMQRILDEFRDFPPGRKATRLKAIIALMAFQGLREVEITRLDVADLNLKQGTSLIHGKSRDDKELIYLHPFTVQAIQEYLQVSKIKSGPLFQSLSNRNKNGRITTRAIQKIVNPFLKGIGIDDKVIHGFRHYFCTKIIKGLDGDLAESIKFTRHKSVETVMSYYDDISMKDSLPKFYAAFDVKTAP